MRMLLEQGEADYAVPDDLVVALEDDHRAHAPLPAEPYARDCAYLFCMELGWAWRDGEHRRLRKRSRRTEPAYSSASTNPGAAASQASVPWQPTWRGTTRCRPALR